MRAPSSPLASPLTLSLALGLALACARLPVPPPAVPGPPAPPPAPPPDRVAPLRADAVALLAAQGEAVWRGWTTGQGGDPSRAWEGRERLLDPASLQAVREAAAGATGDEQRALRLLEAFLVGERLGRETAATGGQLAAARAQAAISWEGRDLALRRVPGLLAQEADAGRRAAIERALVRAETALLPLGEAHRRALESAARGLGADGLPGLYPVLRGAAAPALRERAEEALSTTEAPARALLGALARRELAMAPDRMRSRDLPRLLFLAEEPRGFPAAAAAERALSTLKALGIDLEARAGLVLDGAARPGKDPRALLVPVEVPGSIRVSFAPTAGVAEARAVLRALGGAAYYAEASGAWPELRILDGDTADAWAGLFEELAGDPEWLAEHTGLTPHHLEPVVAAAALRRLWRTREAAARLLLELDRGPDPSANTARAQQLASRLLLRPADPDEAALLAADADPLLRSADTLSTLLLGAQAEAWLVGLGGPAWWRSPEAGAALRSALAEGARLGAEARSAAMGFTRLDAGALVATARARAGHAGVHVGAAPRP